MTNITRPSLVLLVLAALSLYLIASLPSRLAAAPATYLFRPIAPNGRPSHHGISYQPPKPYQARWGRYTVSIDGAGCLDRLRVMDAAGRVLREVRAPDILAVDYPVLRLGHLPALRVLTTRGGIAESSERTYLFSGEHGVRNLLVFTGEITQISHSESGGMADLIADSPVPLEYFTGFDHYGCGTVILVMVWNGDHYVLSNRRHPWASRWQALADRRALVDAAASDRRDPKQVGAALGSCANLWTIGQGSGYFRWMRWRMTQDGWRWFLGAQPELRQRMRAVGRMVSLSQQRVFVLADV